MRVFTDNDLTIDFFPENNYILVSRKRNLDIDMDKYLTGEWLKAIEKYKTEKQLVDYSGLMKPLSAEHQKYAQKNLIIPAIKISVKKVTFIIAKDLYAQMSPKQIMLNTSDVLEFKYFADFNKAKNWLLQK